MEAKEDEQDKQRWRKNRSRINVEKRRRRKELDEMTEEEINRNIGRIMRRKRSNRGMRRMRESVGGRGES